MESRGGRGVEGGLDNEPSCLFLFPGDHTVKGRHRVQGELFMTASALMMVMMMMVMILVMMVKLVIMMILMMNMTSMKRSQASVDCCSRKKTFLRRPLLQRQPHTLLTFALQLHKFTVLRIRHCSTVSDCIAGLCFLLDHSIEQHCTLNSSSRRRGRRGRATTSSLFLVAPSKFEVHAV